MKVESIKYSVSGLACSGALVYDDSINTQRPLLLVAPNWLGVTKDVIERAKTLAGTRETRKDRAVRMAQKKAADLRIVLLDLLDERRQLADQREQQA